MMRDGHIEQADEMLGTLETRVAKTKEAQLCSIPVVNAVLEEKAVEAQKYGIRLETKINLYDTRNISQNHLCSAFANMIDNAIRAERGFTEKDSDRKIINEKSEKNGEYTCTLVMQMKERQAEDFA